MRVVQWVGVLFVLLIALVWAVTSLHEAGSAKSFKQGIVVSEQAEKIVSAIPDIKHVYNLVSVGMPTSTLTRISDTWITGKVKAKMIASNDVDATKVKVITENGTVYLMGVLEPEAAEAAVDIARNTDGVQSVVKVFSYIKITKHLT